MRPSGLIKLVGLQSAVVAFVIESLSGNTDRSLMVGFLVATQLVARRRLNVLIHAGQFVILGLIAVYEDTSPVTLFLLLVSAGVAEVPLRSESTVAGAKALGFLVFLGTVQYFRALANTSPTTLPAILGYASSMAVGVVALTLAHRLQLLLTQEEREAGNREITVNRLQEAAASLLRHADEVRKASRLEERRWISEQLHDVVGRTLTQIIMMMNAMERRLPLEAPEIHRTVTWVRSTAQAGLAEARAVLYRVFSYASERQPTCSELNRLLRIFETISGMKLKIEWCNLSDRALSGVFDIVYAVLAEALTNSYRHGNANAVEIGFWVDPSLLRVRVEDNGTGVSGTPEGIGLQSMRDRVEGAGGSLIHNNTDRGYLVRFTLPVHFGE